VTDRHGLTVPQADALWDAIVPAGPARPKFVEQYDRACKTVAELLAERPKQDVKGRCPACGWTSLFLGDGGYVTCSRLECPNPSAADQLLHGEQPAPGPAATQADNTNRAYRVKEN
jgi:hypothetical protein